MAEAPGCPIVSSAEAVCRAERPGRCCPHGVPLASHARCVACNVLLGCPGEVPRAQGDKESAGLCVDCWAEGIRVLVKDRTKRFYSPREVARILGVSYDTVRDYIRSGELKAHPVKLDAAGPTGNRWRIWKRDFTTFLLDRGMDPQVADLA